MKGNGKGKAAVFSRFVSGAPRWASEPGPAATVILSSRVRFARNLGGMPFPGLSTETQQGSVVNRVRGAMNEVPAFRDADYIACDDLTPEDLSLLVERRLVSRDLAGGHRRRGVLVGRGESLTVMVNEEDHLRLQSMLSGLRLGEALDRLNEVDDILDARLNYAFDDTLGYLTACPTNVGTGMRASVLAHLPALVLTRRAKKVIQGVAAMNMSVRGFYGEGTEVMGNFFQISNQTTLGPDEHEIVSRLDQVVRQIIQYEEEAREVIWRSARLQLEDKIYRAYGTLSSARTISSEEVLSLASAVRFGVALEREGLCPLPVLNEILVFSQPGHVSRMAGRELEQEERRRLRADYIRKRLSEAETEPSSPRGGIPSEDPPRGEE
jgi:protein arginine kinase